MLPRSTNQSVLFCNHLHVPFLCRFLLQIIAKLVLATRAAKKRKYDESYMQYGFTSVIVGGVEMSQGVLCKKSTQ